MRPWLATCAVLLAMATSAIPASAQRNADASQRAQEQRAAHERLLAELARLREAARLETSGDVAGAETIVRSVLEQSPASLTGVLALERLLLAQGRMSEVAPAIDALLERDPASVIGHQIRLRVFSALGDHGRLEDAIDAWVRVTPSIETPYREGAGAWRGQGEHQRAVELLTAGRRRIARDDALALELGDAWAGAGAAGKAAAEWARAVGSQGRGFMLVQRRLQARPDAGASVLPALVEELAAGPAVPGRLRAAALFAIDAGLGSRALDLGRQVLAMVQDGEAESMLGELARRADAGGEHRLAAWAWSELLARATDESQALTIRSRIAELALMAGDTAAAAAAYRDLEDAAAEGSPQRRQALALRVQLAAHGGQMADAAAAFARFREEYAQAPELDATAAALGAALLEAGDAAGAARVLDGVRGPAASRVRARVLLRSGDIAAARDELLLAATRLQGPAATETIALAALLSRLSAAGGELVSQVVAAPEAERAQRIHHAHATAAALPERERAAVLEFLATSADRSGLSEDADAIRRDLVDNLPRSAEAPGALLALARRSAADPERTDDATVLLEKMIVDYPRSALAPQARIELQRLQAREVTR